MNVPASQAERKIPRPTHVSRRWWPRWGPLLALVWSAGTAALAVTWMTDLLPSPFTDPASVSMGAIFNAYDPLVGSAVTLVLGLLGVGCATAALRGAGDRATSVGAWLLAAALLLVMVHGRLLPLLGYLPVTLTVGWFLPGLGPAYLAELLEPESVFLVHCVAGGLVWTMVALAHGRRLRGACGDCGRDAGWSRQQETAVRVRALRVGRIAVAVAAVCALWYPAVRIPWLFGIPVGVGELAPDVVTVGVTLASAGLVGIVLMLGLVQRWGERFPRWMLGLSGRRVPVSLAVAPASVVAVALVALSRSMIFAVLNGQLPEEGAIWIHVGAFVAMLPWGLALAVATAAYAVRRRAECATCGQGRLETTEVARW